MIKVPAWFYRLLWITVAVLGAIASFGAIPILLEGDGVTVVSGGPVIIAGAVFGVVILVYALWRLIKPLKPRPK